MRLIFLNQWALGGCFHVLVIVNTAVMNIGVHHMLDFGISTNFPISENSAA